ncbi:MAG: alcohol dehydrogenase [Candidatus Abyssobacteria bacterium SURF_17]|uniref:Alcohol dehydrogenase n=1 Tax=Candidatus Abyssobacteria bacterium SURF_17 TaxID=2093361 RepID=A0A419ERS5_9BACT|nr:MAG: alcohol dehydrogenase [Candidatus Abyssubacteria bacterium SURF_17]
MKAVRLRAEWAPRKGFVLGAKDIEGKLTYLGSKVWRNPRVQIEDAPAPKIADDEVLVEVKVCGICGSDVHMAQADKAGYIFYPGLTAFPVTLGHEFAGVVVEAGKNAYEKRTNKRVKKGEPVCAEEMFWCGRCRPCADGYPNHCEALEEIGFSYNGAFARYVKLKAKYCWSLMPLIERYPEDDVFVAGSLVEPTSVAYNAVIERGGGIRPGDNVAILGGGPIGLAAIAILSRAGASHVVLSEPSKGRAEIGRKMGATAIINPLKENFAERLLELTDGMGAKLYLEATGLPDIVWPQIEDAIWRGRTLNSTVVIVARADAKIPVTGEVFQVRRASIVGAQGHSGHGTFPRVISAMGAGMDLTPLVTKKIRLEDVPKHLKLLQTDREECKITAIL